eukprot:jgi/Ulvmu1/11566/UM079_0009.1
MSLPFLLSCRPSSATSSSKLRGGSAAGSKAYGQARSSLDTGTASVGVKRSFGSSEAELADVSWRQLLGYDAAQESTLESERLKRICVVGAGTLGSSLAESLVSKPGLAHVSVHMSIGGKDAKFELMPGVSVIQGAKDACTWADAILFCCSYAESRQFLECSGVQKAIKGKNVVQLFSGTPDDAYCMAEALSPLGANYLDAFVLSEGTQHVFNHRLSSMMVSGDKHAWKDLEEIVRAVAPASFYGGYKVEWANTTGVGVLTFMTSVRMGLRQAKDIGSKFGLPANVLPQILSGGYLPVIHELVRSQTSDSVGAAAASSLPSQPGHSCHATSRRSLPQVSDAHPGVGSQLWRHQLERIREVCRSAAVDHSIIDGFLASGCPELRQTEQRAAALHQVTVSGASEHQPSVFADAVNFEPDLNAVDCDVVDGFGDMDVDLADGLLTAAWAP